VINESTLAYEGYWDVCTIVGDISANGLNIDDVGFLTRMVDKLVSEIGVDPGRVFAAGSSRGGFMAFRLALEAPSRFRAVAAVSANVPSPENFKCKPAGARHFFRHDHERYGRPPGPVRRWFG
jgi:polyhydroxybutyrate depolymerase